MLFGDCLFDRNKEQSFLFSVKNGDWVERRGIDLEREREGFSNLCNGRSRNWLILVCFENRCLGAFCFCCCCCGLNENLHKWEMEN